VRLQRIFIAVEMSAQLQHDVAALQEKMRTSGVRLRWVKPHNMHFTLRFLGDIPAAQVARAAVATRQAAGGIEPFDVVVAGLGAFPTFDRPQVVWLGTKSGGEDLERLAAALDAQLSRAGFAPEDRVFRAHLTLGRAKDDRHWGDLVRSLQHYREVEIGRQRVDALVVMESRLTPDGPVYSAVEQVPFTH
jgi:2'-5' RNA ligase